MGDSKLKTSFRNIFLTNLSGKVVKSTKQISMDLLQSFCCTHFDAINKGSFKQHVCFFLALVCPVTIKKSIGLQRGKNDRIDAKRIASYAILHHRKLKIKKLYKLPDEDLVRLRSWIIIRDKLVKHKVSTIKLLETMFGAAKLADIETSVSFLQQQLKSVKEKMKTLISIRGKTQTSSLTNKEVKVHLTRVAITAMSWNPQIKAYYKRKTAEGKHKASVINATRAKIIARCFAVIRRQTPFVSLVA